MSREGYSSIDKRVMWVSYVNKLNTVTIQDINFFLKKETKEK